MEIWEKLRNLREENKLTYVKLEEKLNHEITLSTLKAYESKNKANRRKLSNRSIDVLSSFYDVPREYLMYEDYITKKKENIDITEILGLSDKSIEVIKNINSKTISFDDGDEFEIMNSNNIEMFNYLIENFKEMYDFLYSMGNIKIDVELMTQLKELRTFKKILEFIIDNYYNDREKYSKIIKKFEDKVNSFIGLYQSNKGIKNYDKYTDLLIETKNEIVKRAKVKKIKEVDKSIIVKKIEVFMDLTYILEVEISKDISVNKYGLTVNMDDFIRNYHEKLKELFHDEEIEKLIRESEKRKSQYTKSELKKYSIE